MNRTNTIVPIEFLGRLIQCAGFFKLRVTKLSMEKMDKNHVTVELTGGSVPACSISILDLDVLNGVIKNVRLTPFGMSKE